MADDIVTRLRVRAAYADDDYLSYAAADEIERLQGREILLRGVVNNQLLEIAELQVASDLLAREVATHCGDDAWADRALKAWKEIRHG